jgi:hypothetical protein
VGQTYLVKRGLLILVALLVCSGCGSDDSESAALKLPDSEPDPQTQFSCEGEPVQQGDGLKVFGGKDPEGEPFSVVLRSGRNGFGNVSYRDGSGSGGGGLDLHDTNSPPIQRQGFSYGFGQSSFSGTASPDIASVRAIYPAADDTKVYVDACLATLSDEQGQAAGAPGEFGFWYVTIPVPTPLRDDDVEQIEQETEIYGLDADGEPIAEAAPPKPSHGPEKTVTATTSTAGE